MSQSRVRANEISHLTRWFLAFWCLSVLTGFSFALAVDPDPRGYGTHQQFGLPPCSFRLLFGIPCPSCGGTTCVAHFVRGNWIAAVRSNAAVFGLSLTGLLSLPWCWASIHKRRFLYTTTFTTNILYLLISLSTIATAQWLWRILTT